MPRIAAEACFVGAGMLQSQLNVRLLHFFQLLTGLERYRVAGQYRGRRNCYWRNWSLRWRRRAEDGRKMTRQHSTLTGDNDRSLQNVAKFPNVAPARNNP